MFGSPEALENHEPALSSLEVHIPPGVHEDGTCSCFFLFYGEQESIHHLFIFIVLLLGRSWRVAEVLKLNTSDVETFLRQ